MLITSAHAHDIDVVAALSHVRHVSKQLSEHEVGVLVRMKSSRDLARAAHEAGQTDGAADADAELQTLRTELRAIKLAQLVIAMDADQIGRRAARGLWQVTVRSHKEPRTWRNTPFDNMKVAERYLSRKLEWLRRERSPLSRTTFALAEELLTGKIGQTVQSLWDLARSYEAERILGNPAPERHEVVNKLLEYAAELQREVMTRKGPLQEDDLLEFLLLRPVMFIVAGRRHSNSFDMGFFDRSPDSRQRANARPTLPLKTIKALSGKLMKILAAQKLQHDAGVDVYTFSNQQPIARAIMHAFGATKAARKSMFGHIKPHKDGCAAD